VESTVELWVEMARARTPAGDEIVLRHRAGHFEIRFNGWELMSNRAHRSEEALAQFACERLPREDPRILIGGLGMGYTLRAALDILPPSAQVVVAELMAEIVEWNKGPLAPLAGRPLEDSRVELHKVDVADLLTNDTKGFDAVLLDIDNGPDALLYEPNRLFYSQYGLMLVRRALVAGGMLAVWSADRSPGFEDSLISVGFAWRCTEVATRGPNNELHHFIYLCHDGPPSDSR
jgi:spermidine synthase